MSLQLHKWTSCKHWSPEHIVVIADIDILNVLAGQLPPARNWLHKQRLGRLAEGRIALETAIMERSTRAGWALYASNWRGRDESSAAHKGRLHWSWPDGTAGAVQYSGAYAPVAPSGILAAHADINCMCSGIAVGVVWSMDVVL